MTNLTPPPTASCALGLLRIVAVLLFIERGMQKLFGLPVTPPDGSFPAAPSMGRIAGVLETLGGLRVLVGFFTRLTASVLSGLMTLANFIAHFPRRFRSVANGDDAAKLCTLIARNLLLMDVTQPYDLSEPVRTRGKIVLRAAA